MHSLNELRQTIDGGAENAGLENAGPGNPLHVVFILGIYPD